MMTKFQIMFSILALSIYSGAIAQESAATKSLQDPVNIDEIISQGQRAGSNHPGMNAFFEGDFTKAEIEFEREFLSLKRGRSAIENAAFEAVSGQLRSQELGSISSATTPSTGALSGGATSSSINTGGSQSPATSVADGKRKNKTSRGILTDGKVTDHDFSFSKYMAGLSELQLGKYEEAEKSFKTALFYNSKNYDARLRLGLLHLKNERYEDAAKQLEKLDKMRRKCIKISCENLKFITDAAVELASVITNTANNKKQTTDIQ